MEKKELEELVKIKDENELLDKIKDKDKAELKEIQNFFTKKGKMKIIIDVISMIQRSKHKNTVLSEGIKEQTATGWVELDIDDIKPNPKQVRKTFTKKQVQEKADSILERGLIAPITVYKDKDENIILVVGQLRLAAYFLLRELYGEKYSKIKVVYIEAENYSEKDFRRDSLTENIVRTSMTVFDIALAVAEDFEEEKVTNPDISLEKFGAIYGKSKGYISEYLKIAEYEKSKAELTEILVAKEVNSRRLIIALCELDADLGTIEKIVDKYNEGKLRVVDVENMAKKPTNEPKNANDEVAKISLIDEVYSFKKVFKKTNYNKLKGEDKKYVDEKLEEIKKLMEDISSKIE